MLYEQYNIADYSVCVVKTGAWHSECTVMLCDFRSSSERAEACEVDSWTLLLVYRLVNVDVYSLTTHSR